MGRMTFLVVLSMKQTLESTPVPGYIYINPKKPITRISKEEEGREVWILARISREIRVGELSLNHKYPLWNR